MTTSTPVTRGARRSEQEWRAVMAQFACSGLDSAAFCAREGIAPSTFWNWRSRLQCGGRVKAAAPVSPFVELVSDSASRAFDIELDLGRGVVLRMRGR